MSNRLKTRKLALSSFALAFAAATLSLALPTVTSQAAPGDAAGQGAGKNKRNKGKRKQGGQNQRAQGGAITDPDAADAPIADRETFNAQIKTNLRAPNLAELPIPRTNYPIPAGALFASPNGDADARGSDRNRPTTLAHAIAQAPAGGTVVLRGGDYRDVDNLQIERKISLQAMPGESPWIKGSDIVTGFVAEGGRWFAPWNKKFNHPRKPDLDQANPIAGETDMVFVAGRSLKQVMALNELKPGVFFVDATAKRLYLGDDPTGKIVEATAREFGLVSKGKGSAGTSVRGLGFAHYATKALDWSGSDCLFENNVIAWNAGQSFTLRGANHVVRGNIIACSGLSGINGVGANNLLFENNRVSFNNIEGFRVTWAAAGAKFIATKDATMRNNLLEGNQAAAFWFDISAMRNTVIGNTVRHNKGLGIYFELTHQGIIAFNLVQDNGVGIMLSDASSARIWNNTLVDNSKGIAVKDTKRVNIGKPSGGFNSATALNLGATWIASDSEIKNNLFGSPRNAQTIYFDAGQSLKGQNSRTMLRALDHNAYARQGDAPRTLVRWNPGGKPVDYPSLEAFRGANAGFETSAILPNASLFVNEKTADYRLTPNSPLAAKGESLPADIAAAARAAGIALPASGVPIGAFGGSQ